MNIVLKVKEGARTVREKASRLISAVGGRVEGVGKLPEDEALRIRRRAGYCIACAVGGFFFAGAQAPFGTLPFAVALLCASGHAGAFFVFAGAIAGALAHGGGGFAQILILSLVLISRLVLSPRSDVEGRRTFEEGIKLKLLISAVAAFLLSIYSVVDLFQTSKIDALLAFIFIMAVVPLLVFLFDAALSAKRSALGEAGIFALLFVAVFSLSAHTFFGFSFAVSVSFLVILSAGNYFGVLRGTVCGIVCAIACGVNPIVFALAGFASGAFRSFGPVAGTTVSLVFAVGADIYLNGIGTAYVFAGDVIFSALVFIPLAKTGFISRLLPSNDEKRGEAAAEAVTEVKKRGDEKKRLAALSKAFEELSEVFVKLSANLRDPSMYELRRMCDSVFDRYCRRCSLVYYCRQKNYEDLNDSIGKLAESMRDRGFLDNSALPEFFVKRCRNIDKIIADINRARADAAEDAIKRDKTELFALDYEAIAELLRESGADRGRYSLDSDLQNSASKIIRSLGIRALAFGAWGDRCKTILASGVEVGSIAVSSEEIKNALEVGTGLKLNEPEFNFSGEFVAMTLTSARRFTVSHAKALICASGEEVSGDSAACFDSSADYWYGCVCDGMGSGSEASSVSDISSLFLEKMLSAGNCVSVTLKLLSNFIRARSEEYHCTVDVAEIDLFSAKVSFIKCGAPASYVLRSGNIFKIDARSIPVGLTKEITAEKIEMDLSPSDRIIMVSDGVAPDLEGAVWLPELISSCASYSDKDLADIIAKRAQAENGSRDDICALVMTVSEIE